MFQNPSNTAKELGKVLEEAENDYQVSPFLNILSHLFWELWCRGVMVKHADS